MRHVDTLRMQTYCAAPTVQIAITNSPRAKKLGHKVETMIAGAAPSATLIASLEKINIHVNHVYGLTETYGPFTGCIELPEWTDLPEEEFYRRKAMQGNSYITSDEVRVIRTESSAADGYEDVNPDGKEVGEIVVRGNLVMKGEHLCPWRLISCWLTEVPSRVLKRQRSNRQGIRGRLLPFRRSCCSRATRCHQYSGPQQGPHHLRWRERLFPCHRERDLPAS